MNLFLQEYTNFIFLEDQPEPADIIFIPGGGYGALADTAAGLWHQGYAPYILPSGKYSILETTFAGTQDDHYSKCCPNPRTEYEYLHGILRDHGIPKHCILKEDQATYTYENAIYSKKVTDAAQLNIRTAIICCQAFHARRCLLYYQLLFPETRFLICPTVTQDISRDSWYLHPGKIDRVLGEVERCGSQFHDIIKGLSGFM